MDKTKYLSKDEVVKIIKHEFDEWLNSSELPFKNYREIHCIFSPTELIYITPSIPNGSLLIITFNREESGDVIQLDWIKNGVDSKWLWLQKIKRTQKYEDILNTIKSKDTIALDNDQCPPKDKEY